MQLRNVNIIGNGKGYPQNIRVHDTGITAVVSHGNYPQAYKNEPIIDFEDAIAFPGLINSHDHLDFNLFPKTGNRIYHNYTEWGKDIHLHNKEIIARISKIPAATKIQSGVYKNLLNGITTVVNHGAKLKIGNNLIDVIQNHQCLHSIGFEKNWKLKLNNPRAKKEMVVIHAGEGTDTASEKEMDTLLKWNLLHREIIAVHGVAMTEQQAGQFKALVWCPASNYFLLNKTAAIDKIKNHTSVIFGTDSTLTSQWNLWEHLRLARASQLVSDHELFEMLTTKPAAVWGLNKLGRIEETYAADIVVAKKKKPGDMDSFYALHPEDILLVVRNGEIKLFDSELRDTINATKSGAGDFNKVGLGKSLKYVKGVLTEPAEHLPFYSG